MFVCCECCVLSGRGLCDELITRPDESYRLWCVAVCDLETSRMRRPWPPLGLSAKGKEIVTFRSYCVSEKHSTGRFRMNHRVSVSARGGSFAIPVETVIMIMVTVMTPHCSHQPGHGHVVLVLYRVVKNCQGTIVHRQFCTKFGKQPHHLTIPFEGGMHRLKRQGACVSRN